MECKRFEEKLNSCVESGLSEDEIREFQDHLDSCPHCARALEDLKKTKAWLGRLGEIEPPPWFEQKIMQRVRLEQEKKTVWQKLFQPLHIKLPIQALATAVVVIIAVQVFRTVEPEVKTTIPAAPVPAPVSEIDRDPESSSAPEALAEKKKAPGAPLPAVPSEKKAVRQERVDRLKKEIPENAPKRAGDAPGPAARPATAPSAESIAGRTATAPSPSADLAGMQDSYEASKIQEYGSRLELAGDAALKAEKEQKSASPMKSYDAMSRKKAKAPKPGPALMAQSAQSVLIIINPHAPDTAMEDIRRLFKSFNAANVNASSEGGLITADVPAEKLQELSSQLARFGELRTIQTPSHVSGTVQVSINIGPPSAKADEKAR